MINVNELLKKYDIIKKNRIEIVLSRKCKKEIIEVTFDDTNFKHLIGIHKLTDTNYSGISMSSSQFCDEVRKGSITQSDLEKSSFFFKGKNCIDDPPAIRFELLNKLICLFQENSIDPQKLIPYKVSSGQCFSIKANYQFKILKDEMIRFFIVLDGDYYIPSSIIQNTNPKYDGELRTLLYVALYNTNKRERKELFSFKNFIPEFDSTDRLINNGIQ